jgi:hypothetical protein
MMGIEGRGRGEKRERERERERELFGISYKGTNPITRTPPSCPCLALCTYQRPHLLYHHMGD